MYIKVTNLENGSIYYFRKMYHVSQLIPCNTGIIYSILHKLNNVKNFYSDRVKYTCEYIDDVDDNIKVYEPIARRNTMRDVIMCEFCNCYLIKKSFSTHKRSQKHIKNCREQK